MKVCNRFVRAVLSYKEHLYKERLVEYENHKEQTLVKLGRDKEQVFYIIRS